jgi:hypothetical protein
VGQLNTRYRALLSQEGGDAGQKFDMFVLPDAVVLGGNAAASFHGGSFHDHQPGATGRAASQVDQMPVVGKTILTGVLAHGRHRDAVAEGHFANGKRGQKSGHASSMAALGVLMRRLASRGRSVAKPNCRSWSRFLASYNTFSVGQFSLDML